MVYILHFVTVQYYFIFFLKLLQLWPLGDFLAGSSVPFIYPHWCVCVCACMCVCVCACVCVFPSLLYFLVQKDTQSSSCTLPAPVLELAIFQGPLAPFIGKTD